MRLSAVLLVLFASSVAFGQSVVERGRVLFLEADFEGSRAVFAEALEAEAQDRGELVASLMYLTAIDSVMGDDAQAEQWAQDALALDADAQLPEGSPSEATERVEALRGQVEPIEIELAVDGTDPNVRFVVARQTGTLHLRAELVLQCGEDEVVGQDGEARVELRATQDRCEAVLQSESGGELVRESLVIAPLVVTEQVVVAPEETDGPRVGLILGIVGAVLAAAAIGIVLALVLGGSESPQLSGIEVEGFGGGG